MRVRVRDWSWPQEGANSRARRGAGFEGRDAGCGILGAGKIVLCSSFPDAPSAAGVFDFVLGLGSCRFQVEGFRFQRLSTSPQSPINQYPDPSARSAGSPLNPHSLSADFRPHPPRRPILPGGEGAVLSPVPLPGKRIVLSTSVSAT